MGQSFRVGWGPNWTLAHSGSQISNPSTGKVSLFTGFGRPHVDKESGLPIRAVLERIGARKGDSVAVSWWYSVMQSFLPGTSSFVEYL